VQKALSDLEQEQTQLKTENPTIATDDNNHTTPQEPIENPTTAINGNSPTTPQEPKDERVKISPLARRISGINGVDFTKIQHGTGPGGRIVKADVIDVISSDNIEDYLVKGRGSSVQLDKPKDSYIDEYTEKPLSQIQRYIAERLTRSWHDAPHFYMTISANVTELLKVKSQLNDSGALPVRLTVTDFMIKASALALIDCPRLNVSWSDGMVRSYNKSNISVVIATDEGIFSPVIYGACSKSICQISAELKELTKLAKSKKIPPEKSDGGTLTISNLGMYGIDGFFAVINPKQGTALSIGPARKTPVYSQSGEIIPADIIQFGYSIDHRLINGVDAAIFLEKLVKYIENPLLLVVG
jgi:pyruvate dehydrogenase E2 component (dihydrolipoamide acetyltransferase)